LISKPALENTYTTICLNLKEKGDVTAAAKAMLLESDEARYLGKLPVGSAIVKLQARWVKPFLVTFPLFSISKGTVTDAQVHEQFLESLDVETVAGIMKEAVDATLRLAQSILPAKAAPPRPAVSLNEQELSLLKDVAEFPVSPVTERYARLGLNPNEGNPLVSGLVEQGLLASASIPTRGSHIRLLGLATAGRSLLGLPEETDRHGSLEHRYWVETLWQALKDSGFSAEKEARLGEGKAVDLLASLNDMEIAIEVETGKSDWQGNVRKCLEGGMNQVIVVPTRAAVFRRMKAAGEQESAKGRVHIISPDRVPEFVRMLAGKS
jgi:hypothetical protein